MVVFTCNICGESLQKPKVEKHYFTVCRKAPKSLSCVDCFKDFLNEEYVAHTKCVTEEERYAAKGSFPKGIVKKGEVKQQSWTEVITSVIENTTDVKPGQQQIFTLMLNSVNVPRKKNKFMNFVKSALGRKAFDRDIESVWGLLEKLKGQQAEVSAGETVKENGHEENVPVGESSKKSKDEVNNENEKTEEIAVNGSSVEGEGLKKKKKKSKDIPESNEIKDKAVENAEVAVNECSVESSKKKKKSKNVEENGSKDIIVVNNEVEEITVNGTSVESSKKKKRKSKNLEENEDESKPTNNSEEKESTEVAVNGTSVESSKKKKRKSKNVEENWNEGSEVLTNETLIDSKKKKKKSQDVQESTETLDKNNEELTENPKKKKRKSKDLNDDNNIENPSSNVNEMEPLKKKKKKTDLNKAENDQTKLENIEEPTANGAEETSKGKKRNLKDSENESATAKQMKNEENDQDPDGCKFCYKETILEILKVKKSISKKKLEKKVFDVYRKVKGIEPTEQIRKKFENRLKKVSGIEISEDNNVILLEN